jgi:hypothetical protein
MSVSCVPFAFALFFGRNPLHASFTTRSFIHTDLKVRNTKISPLVSFYRL